MDTDWFLKVIEGSSVSSDLQLSFGETAWENSVDTGTARALTSNVATEECVVDQESPKQIDVEDQGDTSQSDKSDSESRSGVENFDTGAGDWKLTENTASSCDASLRDCNDRAVPAEVRDDQVVLTPGDKDYESSSSIASFGRSSRAETSTSGDEIDEDVESPASSVSDGVFDDSDNVHSNLRPRSLHYSDMESSSSTDHEYKLSQSDKESSANTKHREGGSDFEETLVDDENLSESDWKSPAEQSSDESDKEGCKERVARQRDESANHSTFQESSAVQPAACASDLERPHHDDGDDDDGDDENNTSNDDSMGNEAVGDIDDESLMDFAGELGVTGSDSSDSECSDDEDTFSFSLPNLTTACGQSQESRTSFNFNRAENSEIGEQLSRTNSQLSQLSAGSRNSRLSRCSLARQARVELKRTTRPISLRSQRSSICSNTSSASLCSRRSDSKLSRTSLNRIPVTRKPSKRIPNSSSSSTSSSGSITLPKADSEQRPVPAQTESPTEATRFEISEAEQSWLPPLAFTDEDVKSKKKPENKAVGALLQEFVRLRRSVSDEYELAEKVCLRKKRESAAGTDKVSPEPDDEKLQKMERKRAKVIKEILETEKTYQHHLDMIVKYFEGPLRQNQIIPDHVIVTIFSNIRQIISINKELWQSLDITNIGRAFLKMGPFLKLYSTYANNHERALATLMQWDQKSADFSKFRREQEDEADMSGLKLNALLITPVQRVPRYKLLLTELLENTTSTHDDYTAIQEACRQISAVATHINEHIKQQDNFIKMLAIQKSLSGTGAPRLLIPGRIFIKEGALRKVSKNGTSSRERMFFLFSDILIYAKYKLVDSGAHHSYVCCCILPLQHCSVTRVFGHSKEQGALFSITCKQESLLLYSDQKTVSAWMLVLTKTINELLENRQSLRKVSSAKQPLRKAALAKLKKQQKELDPLRMSQKAVKRQSTKRLQEAIQELDTATPSPKLKKSKLVGDTDCNMPPRSPKIGSPLLDLNCLTPRSKHKKAKGIKGCVPADFSKVMTSFQPAALENSDQPPIDLDCSDIWKLHNESCIVGAESSPSRASFHGFDPNTPQNKQKTRATGHRVNTSRQPKLTNIDWDDALQTATQTARLFNPNPISCDPYNNNTVCSIQ